MLYRTTLKRLSGQRRNMTDRSRNNHFNPASVRPTVFAETTDIDGRVWHVNERRITAHDFPVELGWPADYAGPGAAHVILTPPLAAYLRGVSRFKDLLLPLNNQAVSRFRVELEMDYRSQRERWWREREDDLRVLSHREFACRHGVSEAAVTAQSVQRCGPRKRPVGWYREPEIAHMLLTLPLRDAARQLGINYEAAMTHRKLLRRSKSGSRSA